MAELDIDEAAKECLTYLLAKLGDKSTPKAVPLTILQATLPFGRRATSVRVATVQTIAGECATGSTRPVTQAQ